MNLPNIENIIEMYTLNKWGMSRIVKELELKNIKTSVGYIANRLRENNIPIRSCSEAALVANDSIVDYNASYLTETVIEWIDGFLLGDGSIGANGTTARASCALEHKEFCDYMMSGFKQYYPSESHLIPYKEIPQNGNIGCWNSRTLGHPDLLIQRNRWYPNGKKIIPQDVRITPMSVMLWYLGDGCLRENKEDHTISIQLSSECFTKEENDILISKLKSHGIDCYWNNEKRIRISSKGVINFFKLIGRISPVSCYNYKFEAEEWRFDSKRASEVATELSVNLGRLQHLIKVGKVPCFRASEKGRPRLNSESIEICKKLIETGDLY